MAKGRIYITGAAGRLGRAVLAELPGAVPLVRKASGLPGEIVTDYSTESLRRILADASALIHLAGSRDFLDMKKAREGNVELTRRIIESSPESARIVFASSISVYGKKLAKNPADEGTKTRPDTPYAQTKLEAESIVSRHPAHVILRIGPIYGPGFNEYFKVLRMLADGRMPILGNGGNHIPFVHVADVARVIRNATGRGRGVYLIVGECLTQQEIFRAAAKELGVAPPKKQMPAILAASFAHLELFRSSRFGGKPPAFIPEDIAVLTSDRIFDSSKAKRELGFSPRPLREGILEMVQELRGRKR